MKRFPAFPALVALSVIAAVRASAQNAIENVVVETYYVSDAVDAVPNEAGGTLAEGSRTYRVYLDLCDSCALVGLYGSGQHPFDITSTALFYNNPDRGRTYGHMVNNGALDENTVALDSWLSLGGASTSRFGVLKEEDPDDASTLLFPNDLGMLGNDDALAGIPLTVADGLVQDTLGTTPPSFLPTGLVPDSVFGDSTAFAAYVSDSVRISCTGGMRGHGIGNKVLIAQLTTTGELSFHINVEISQADGTIRRYVPSDTLLAADETPNGLLVYPPACGCTDPDYLEYDPTAGCDDGSCATAIVFGCLDTLACNYDPGANFHLAALCCYGPGNCNGLDPQVVCPGVGVEEPLARLVFEAHPNPVEGILFFTVGGDRPAGSRIELLDGMGRLVLWEPVPAGGGAYSGRFDLSLQERGVYLLRMTRGGTYHTRVIVKG